MNPEVIGMIAAILTSFGYMPQAIKVIRTRQTRDLSLIMYSVMTTGGITWFIYGLMIESWPVILANGFTTTVTATILAMKLKHG